MQRGAAIVEVRLIRGAVEYAALAPFPQDAGAECVFLGRTRLEHQTPAPGSPEPAPAPGNGPTPGSGPLVRLDYEAYEPMAQRVLTELAHAAVEQFDCLAVRIHHAVGSVPVGEASVLVQVACSRRDASFLACRFLIDQLKATAPIWKREVWSDGATWPPGQQVATPGVAIPGVAIPGVATPEVTA